MKKKFITKIKELFASEETVSAETIASFVDVKTSEGRIFRIDGETIMVDAKVQEILEDGTVADVEDETYTLEDGSTIVTVGSVITEYTEATGTEDGGDSETGDVTIEIESPSTETEDMSKIKIYSLTVKENFSIIKEVSKWEISVDNTTFNEGDKVTYTYEDVQYTVNDGEYELEDGSKIFVDTSGIIVLVKPASTSTEPMDEEVETELSEEESEAFAKVKEVTENFKSLQEKYSKLEADFETFKKQASTEHTNLSIEFNDTKKEKPKSVLHSMLNK